ncbi:Ca2+-transporting ATPase [Pseudoduganella namucuonensis]|uniref:Ca2+-transporting ATPase n=1 Tax=Pseudoduganella namucuonensis TaxID=1035707 RepID=A0A1I7KNN7_9BURK|nr:Ca2+-transporting ATPase [Pseudoduganella namucuonensis]
MNGPPPHGGTAPPPSLDSEAAARLLAEHGPNRLPEPARRRWWHIAAGAAREPMFALLLAAAGLYLALGELREGLFLACMVALTLGITLYQEGRTEHALQALRALSAPVALAVRDGVRVTLPAAGLVPGDLIILGEGDRVPADAWLIEGNGVRADESLLTGESVPVDKAPTPLPGAPQPPGGDGLPWVYSGTLIVQGHGMARVAATGAASEIGKLGSALRELSPPPSPLQRQGATLARRLAVAGLAASALLTLLLASRDGLWVPALLAGIALSMSMLPEELPVILTVFPALGAWRLSRRRVLTRRLAAIETLGSTSVLCVDKTGTLTENRMAVGRLWCAGGDATPRAGALTPEQEALLTAALLASHPRSRDPMERAFAELAGRAEPGAAAAAAGLELLREYGLSPSQPALAQAWGRADGAPAVVAIKGAPEYVLGLCALTADQRALALLAAEDMARQGLRVLAVAHATHAGDAWPSGPEGFSYSLLGLAGLADPLRPGIAEAVAECRAAGVRLLMITGDHPVTACAIAAQAGIATGGVLRGPDLDAMDDAQLARALAGAGVCARVRPEQKLRIVRALQRGGAVVAMTGDGVNDAPALRAADVGIAMGQRGTDVAREAAQLTLLDDSFASIVEAIRAGRRIYSNMRKAVAYVLAMHLPIAGLALLPPLLGWPVLLLPMHIVFMELIIDPACSLAFEGEPEERDLMRTPPRPAGRSLFGRGLLLRAVLQGGAMLALIAAAYGAAATLLPADQARGFGFAVLVLGNLALLLANRRQDGAAGALMVRNPVFWGIVGAALAALLAALYMPAVGAIFRVAPPTAPVLAAAAVTGLAMMLALHLLRERRPDPPAASA